MQTIMEYRMFQEILNEHVFEKSKANLLEKIAEAPYRYIGLFRPTRPKAKLLQNLLHSQEIKFGDALEILIEKYLEIKGAKLLPKKYQINNKPVAK